MDAPWAEGSAQYAYPCNVRPCAAIAHQRPPDAYRRRARAATPPRGVSGRRDGSAGAERVYLGLSIVAHLGRAALRCEILTERVANELGQRAIISLTRGVQRLGIFRCNQDLYRAVVDLTRATNAGRAWTDPAHDASMIISIAVTCFIRKELRE